MRTIHRFLALTVSLILPACSAEAAPSEFHGFKLGATIEDARNNADAICGPVGTSAASVSSAAGTRNRQLSSACKLKSDNTPVYLSAWKATDGSQLVYTIAATAPVSGQASDGPIDPTIPVVQEFVKTWPCASMKTTEAASNQKTDSQCIAQNGHHISASITAPMRGLIQLEIKDLDLDTKGRM